MATEEPARLPLLEAISSFHDGISSDGVMIVFPDDPGYERAYRIAVRAFQKYGSPMPYAGQDDIESERAEHTAAAS